MATLQQGRLILAGNQPRILTFTANQATITPAIILSSGAPTPIWIVTESNGTVYTYTTAGFTHNRRVAGDITIKLSSNVYNYVTQLDSNSDGLKGLFTAADLAMLPKLQQLRLYNNPSLNCSFSLANLPASMTQLHLYGTGSTITGSLANLPAGMTQLWLYSTTGVITGSLANLPAGMTQLYLNSSNTVTGSLVNLPATMDELYLSGSVNCVITGSLADLPAGIKELYLNGTGSTITGSLADLPAGMRYLSLNSTGSTITGGASAMVCVGIREIQIQNIALSQPNVDNVLARLYTDRATLTYTGHLLNIGGTNSAPSGTYRDGDPPTTGKEYVYELVNDPEAEGFRKWTITYTA